MSEPVKRQMRREIPDENFRLLADNQPVFSWIADETGYIYWYSRRWYDYTGTTPAEMEGWGWKSVHDPRTVDEVVERWTESLATGEPFDMIFPLRSAGGDYRTFLSRAQPVRDAHGRITHWCGNNIDITAQQAVETVLAEREAQSRHLLAMLDLSAVIVRQLDGVILFWSAGFERIYGWSAKEAVGRSAHELLETVFPVSLQEIETVLLREGEWSGDLRHRRRDGTEIIVAARKVLQRDAGGNPAAVMESVADVTALRRAEDELRLLNADLETRVREEVAAREATQARLAQAEKMSALGELAGGVAHDFNNILQTVSGSASLIKRNLCDVAKVTRYARLMEDASERGASITRRLLAFARRDDLHAEPVNVGAVLDGVREVLAHTMGASITVRLGVKPGLPHAQVDQSQLETALVNLATNARDALDGDEVIAFSADLEAIPARENSVNLEPGDYIRLCVSDTGAGMDEKTLARALEPFFTTKEKGKGTGLGLSMARGFAEQSGGALSVESAPGSGTKVTIWLPASNARNADKAGRDAPSPEPAAARILLVDDDEPVLQVVGEELSHHGYSVVPVASAAAALALLNADERFDALVSDFSMPAMDGLTLIRAAQEQRPGLPAILLTGYTAEAEAVFGGPVDSSLAMLRKPITGVMLAERIASLLLTAGRASHD